MGVLGHLQRLETVIASAWRRLFIPKVVREIEDAGAAAAAHETTPGLPPPVERRDIAGLGEANARLARLRREEREIEERMAMMSDLYGRMREEGEGEDVTR